MNKNYRAFAGLVADSFFELDAELNYIYSEGREAYFNKATPDLIGRSRLELIEAAVNCDHQLSQHHRAFQARTPVDIVIASVCENGQHRHTNVVAAPQFDKQNMFTGYLGCTRDVTQSVLATQRIRHQASHDDLTGVVNRREFEARVATIVSTQGEESLPRCVCFIDLDKFKHVNDSAGHPAGDQLLRNLTGVMRAFVRGSETLARLGGDEFALLLNADSKQATVVAERMIDAISQYEFSWDGQDFKVGASIGIAPITANTNSVEDVLLQADNACYAAKDNGRNQSFVYGAESISYHQRRRATAKNEQIKEALQTQNYTLYLQPVLSNSDACDVKMREVLLRLKCQNGRLLEPAEFMPIASKFDLMQSLDSWVINNSMLALAQFAKQGEDCKLSINLSANSLNDDKMLQHIVRMVSESAVSAESLCFEFTEAAAMRNFDAVHKFMRHLGAEGVEFALDDFGGGLSSLSYLRDLPVSYIKLDETLINNIVLDKTNQIIVGSLQSMARQLGIKTIAKSVENVETRYCIKSLGLDYSQGFGVAKPREIDSYISTVSLHPLQLMAS